MEFRQLTVVRAVMAVISIALEEGGIWAVWYYILPYFDILLPVGVLIAVMVGWLAFSIWLFIFTTKVLKKQKPIGLTGMIGLHGYTVEKLAPRGMVRIQSELWMANSIDGDIEKGEEIVVTGENGLLLDVRRVDKATH